LNSASAPLGSDRARNVARQFPRLVLPALGLEIFPHLLAQEPQDIELLVVVVGASPDVGFADLTKPFRTVTWCNDVRDLDLLSSYVAQLASLEYQELGCAAKNTGQDPTTSSRPNASTRPRSQLLTSRGTQQCNLKIFHPLGPKAEPPSGVQIFRPSTRRSKLHDLPHLRIRSTP